MGSTSRAAWPAGHLGASFTNGLAGAKPATGPRRLAGLSDKQRQTFLGEAARRVQGEAKTRAGSYIRALDRIHASGCRTRQQRWDALAAIIEPALARLDLATLVLGWMDDAGQFRLNRQRGLAEDSGLSDVRVSRTLTALEAAGYVRRKQRRLFKDGARWITRTMIHLRPRFFADLGLSHLLDKARARKKARRVDSLLEVARRRRQAAEAEAAALVNRQQARRRAQAAQREAAQATAQVLSLEQARAQVDAVLDLLKERPDLTPTQARALLAAL